MQTFSAEQVHQVLTYPEFVNTLAAGFGADFTMPPPQVLPLDPDGPGYNALAILPAWNDEVIALKSFTYFPENRAPELSIYAQILLFDRHKGKPLALVDGTSVTYYRTAGISALASRLLSREDSEELLLINTGQLAPFLVEAHASVRPLKRIRIWGRTHEKAAGLAAELATRMPQLEISAVPEIKAACSSADLIICATNSPKPLVHGSWVRYGTHCDFLGNHHPEKRECDTELVAKSKVWVDSKANCLKEAGEILIPLEEEAIETNHILGDLAELCSGKAPKRKSDKDITLFKAVGCALGDLIGAQAVWQTKR